jgi:hypothetical protein
MEIMINVAATFEVNNKTLMNRYAPKIFDKLFFTEY